MDFGLGPNTVERLREINDRLLSDVRVELSPETLLAKHSFPDRYQAVARMLLASDDPAPIFESIAEQELGREAAINPFRQAIAEPLVVLGLAYLGLIFLCSYTLPHIETQYAQQGQTPSGATQLLIIVRDAMPYWAIGLPILMMVLWLTWRKLAKGALLHLFPGSRPYGGWLVAETQSRRLSALVGSGVDQETALTLATTSVSPQVPVRPIAESIVRDGVPQSQPRALNRLARFYGFLAEDRRRTYFTKAPALIGLFFAGIVVFAYALATFLPWIEVLSNLSGLGAMQP